MSYEKAKMYERLLRVALQICNAVLQRQALSSKDKDAIALELTGYAKENEYGIIYCNGPTEPPHTNHGDMSELTTLDLCLCQHLLGKELVACVQIQWRDMDALVASEIYMKRKLCMMVS